MIADIWLLIVVMMVMDGTSDTDSESSLYVVKNSCMELDYNSNTIYYRQNENIENIRFRVNSYLFRYAYA